MCGERTDASERHGSRRGSSPRVRGTRHTIVITHDLFRFIPACAGNAARAPQGPPTPPVHPRVCGERSICCTGEVINPGSSPRVRGTRGARDVDVHSQRFIPACAGNASAGGTNGGYTTVHPRVCGERRWKSKGLPPTAGSSPRVRGTPRRSLFRQSQSRFIPACAGNACAASPFQRESPVHPRVCGERVTSPLSRPSAPGSSPRVRGTPGDAGLPHHPIRFIPACAGNATPATSISIPISVHPRVCGERSDEIDAARHCRRFIPACAGNAWVVRVGVFGMSVHPRVCGERLPPRRHAINGSGSSPRVRGTRPSAAAGSTHTTVHPRVCGERDLKIAQRTNRHGSSPRVRGTLNGHEISSGLTRFIPACAGNAVDHDHRRHDYPVHPRVCGERLGSLAPRKPDPGSSPRVRGTHFRARPDHLLTRFIPACAGNAASKSANMVLFAVHPRVCGERIPAIGAAERQAGSSPRVRGTLATMTNKHRMVRFIPACAGNARTPFRPSSIGPVHPRVCGERRRPLPRKCSRTGSSPRVRGTLNRREWGVLMRRFIPACAGNARRDLERMAGGAVHPRVCGERRWLLWRFLQFAGSSPRVRGTRWPTTNFASHCGSSPRVRGTRRRRRRRPPIVRFIPACAGNARSPFRPASIYPVHPRVCGERRIGGQHREQAAGSSPRVRGTRAPLSAPPVSARFIPACAGNAAWWLDRLEAGAVHPRVCGERRTSGSAHDAFPGSSPRVRGTPHQTMRTHVGPRFIPACAGNAGDPDPIATL